MNITELRYLVAIMECGSVSAAAKRLYAAQPNVSKALKNLEEEYHLRIFERSSTGMIPTEQGRHFIEQAERVLREVDRLDQSVQEAQERCAELRVMIPHATYASYAAVDYLEKVSSIERLHIHIREGGSMEALDFVLRRGYHLALLRFLSILIGQHGTSLPADTTDTRRLKTVLQLIEAEYATPLRIEDAAEACGCSQSHFMRWFKKMTGQGFTAYLNDHRLNLAAELLRITDATVLDIAGRVGFDNLSYFNRLFKRRYGMTPREYRSK